ncbi:MAG: hypothetical protein Kow00109_14450 [Acidobacteriota bacterium]
MRREHGPGRQWGWWRRGGCRSWQSRATRGQLRAFTCAFLLFLSQLPALAQQGEEPSAPEASSRPSVAQSAAAALEQGKTGEALRLYQRGVAANPEWDEGWWWIGVLEYEQRRWAEAVKAFRTVTALQPELGPAWVMTGVCQYQLKKFYRALDNIERGLSLGLGGNAALRFSAFYHKAVLLTRIEEYERAFNILYSLAKQQPNSEQVIAAMGVCILRLPLAPAEVPGPWKDVVRRAGQAFVYSALDEGEKAQELLEELIAADPRFPNLHYAYGQFLAVRNSARAEEMFRKELELDPNHVPARLQLAWLHLNRGRSAEALPLAEEALELDPDSASPRYVLGRVLLDLGRYEDAARRLEEARELAPESSLVHQYLAQTYFRLGRREEAQAELAEVDRLRRRLLEQEQGLIVSGTGREDASEP